MIQKKYFLLYFISIFIVSSMAVFPNENSLNAFASPPQNPILTRGYDYQDLAYPNGTHVWTGGLKQMLKFSNGTLTAYSKTDNGTGYIIKTGQGTYYFDKSSCSMYLYPTGNLNSSSVAEIGKEYFTMYYSQAGSGIWSAGNFVNNLSCSPSFQAINSTAFNVTGNKTSPGQASFAWTYTKDLDHDLKSTISAKNLNNAWNNYLLGVHQFDNVPRIVQFGNSTYDLSLYNNTVLNRNWIGNHTAQIANFLGKYSLDVSRVYGNLEKIIIHYKNNQATLEYSYTYNNSIVSPGTLVSYDPTYGYTTGLSYTYDAQDPSATACTSANISGYSNNTGSNTDIFNSIPSDAGSHCRVRSFQWDISSVPSGYVISGATLKFDVTDIGVTLANCNMTKVGHLPGQGTSNRAWNDAVNGTQYVSNSAICATAGTGKTQSLGSQANTDIKTARSSSQKWFAIGVTRNTKTNDNKGEGITNVQLTFNYNLAPNPPTLTSVTQVSSTSLNASWTSSTGATYYLVNRTSPAGGTLINVYNVTSLFKVDTGLTPGTQYQYGIQAGNATGFGSVSNLISRYTVNVAPTSLTNTTKTDSIERVGWTNPTGNFSGFKVEHASGSCSSYSTDVSNTNNSTNRYDVTGLSGNTKYCFRVSTNYATGSSDQGTSSPSSIVSGYTLPASPTGLTAFQNIANRIKLSWTDGGGNGTTLGFKIEHSINNGATWTTDNSNTGNSTTVYTLTNLPIGKIYFRVSEIKYGGTSIPSSTTNIIVWGITTFIPKKFDNSTSVPSGSGYQNNATSSGNYFSWSNGGNATIYSTYGNQNFTFKDPSTLFVTKTLWNQNTTAKPLFTVVTNDILQTCPASGSQPALELFPANDTNQTRMTMIGNPTCYQNNTLKYHLYFFGDGKHSTTSQTTVRVKILNASIAANPSMTINRTKVTTVFSSPWVLSAPINLGSGLTNIGVYVAFNFTTNPAYIPVNFTAGGLNVTGSNTNTASFIWTQTNPTTSQTVVTATYPSTFNLTGSVGFTFENKTKVYPSLTQTSVGIGQAKTTFTFNNVTNGDVIKINLRDKITSTNSSYTLTSQSGIPFVQQIKNLKAGTYGTTAQLGSLDMVTVLVIIGSMIGLNRVNEALGIIVNVMFVGALAWFGIYSFPSVLTPAIALLVMVTVASTKKLPWS